MHRRRPPRPAITARRSQPGVVARRLLDDIDVVLAAAEGLGGPLHEELRRAAPALAAAVD